VRGFEECCGLVVGLPGPGLPIIRYRNVQQALFDALATTYAMNCFTESVNQPSRTRAGTATVAWAPWAAANRDRALTKVWTVIGRCGPPTVNGRRRRPRVQHLTSTDEFSASAPLTSSDARIRKMLSP
jgi:hypothetical protein